MQNEKKLQSLEAFQPYALAGSTTRKVTGGDYWQGTGANTSTGTTDERRWSGTSRADGGSGNYVVDEIASVLSKPIHSCTVTMAK